MQLGLPKIRTDHQNFGIAPRASSMWFLLALSKQLHLNPAMAGKLRCQSRSFRRLRSEDRTNSSKIRTKKPIWL